MREERGGLYLFLCVIASSGCLRDASLDAVAQWDGERCLYATVSQAEHASWRAATPLGEDDDGQIDEWFDPDTFIRLYQPPSGVSNVLDGPVTLRIERDRLTSRGPITDPPAWFEDWIGDLVNIEFNELRLEAYRDQLDRVDRYGLDFSSEGIPFSYLDGQRIPIRIENGGHTYRCYSEPVSGHEWIAAHNGYVEEVELAEQAWEESGAVEDYRPPSLHASRSFVRLTFDRTDDDRMCPIAEIDLRVLAANPPSDSWGRPDSTNLAGCGPGSMHSYSWWPRVTAEMDETEWIDAVAWLQDHALPSPALLTCDDIPEGGREPDLARHGLFTVAVGAMIGGSLPEVSSGFDNVELRTTVDYMDMVDGLPVGLYRANPYYVDGCRDWLNQENELVARCELDFSAGTYDSSEQRLVESRAQPFSVVNCIRAEPGCMRPRELADCVLTGEPLNGITASVWFDSTPKNVPHGAGYLSVD